MAVQCGLGTPFHLGTLTREAPEFIRRLLSHVLPPGLHKVRYGACPERSRRRWLHSNARRRFLQVQTLLAVPLIFAQPTPSDPPAHLRCPHCGKFAARLPSSGLVQPGLLAGFAAKQPSGLGACRT